MTQQTKVKNINDETLKAGCVVMNDAKEILLISDSKGEIWTFPKGHTENGEDLEQVALREVKEETGYEVEILKKLSDVTYEHGQTSELIRVAMFQARVLELGPIIEKDIQSRWFPLEEAKRKVYHNLAFILDEVV